MDHGSIERGRKTDGKTRLIEAAGSLFAWSGFEQVSVADILSESGLKAPSLYHHFKDKEGLYVEWAFQTMEGIAAKLAKVRDLQRSRPEDLVFVVRALLHGPDMDILQVQKDIRIMKSAASQRVLGEALEFNIFRPIEQLVLQHRAATDDATARKKAVMLVQLSMALHPVYQTAAKSPLTEDDIVRAVVADLRDPVARTE